MKDIRINYRWFLFNLSINRQIPERWEELNARQLIAIAKLVKGEITDDGYLHEFGDIPLRVIKKLDTYQKYSVGKILAFTEGFEPWYKFILKLPGLVPPRPRLEGMTFGQFIFVDTYYFDWVADQTPELLNKFAGSLYLPEKEKFSTEKTTLYIENAAQLKEVDKIAISLNYRLVKEWLSNLYPLILPHPEEERQTEEAKAPAKPTTQGWLQIFESIVGDDLIHQEEYFELPAHSVLRHITKKIKENAKR